MFFVDFCSQKCLKLNKEKKKHYFKQQINKTKDFLFLEKSKIEWNL